MTTCPTGKVGMAQSSAKKAAKRARAKYTQAMKAYPCSECGQWHIGSLAPGHKSNGPMKIIHKRNH